MDGRTYRRGPRDPSNAWRCRWDGHRCYFSNHGDSFTCETCGKSIMGVPPDGPVVDYDVAMTTRTLATIAIVLAVVCLLLLL